MSCRRAPSLARPILLSGSPAPGDLGSRSDAGGGTRTPDTRIMILSRPAVMRFLSRPTLPRMLFLLPKLRSSVHGSVHRRHRVASESSAVDDRGSGGANLTMFRSRSYSVRLLRKWCSSHGEEARGSGRQRVSGQFRGRTQQRRRTIAAVPCAVGPVPTSPISGRPQSPVGRLVAEAESSERLDGGRRHDLPPSAGCGSPRLADLDAS